MTPMPLAFAAMLLAGTAFAQSTTTTTPPPAMPAPAPQGATTPGVNPATGVRSDAGVVERNQGVAAASGDRNQAVATTDANALQPAHGANSFTEGQAQSRIEDGGFQNVSGLRLDDNGVWRGTATQAGNQVGVWLDYKGNVGRDGVGRTATTAPSAHPSGGSTAPAR